MSLLDLPTEILLQIATRCPRMSDISRFSRTNRLMHSILTPVLDKSIVADYGVNWLLIWASQRGNVPLVLKLLAMGANVNFNLKSKERTPELNSALHFASDAGNVEMVRLLIKNGAKVVSVHHQKDSLNFAVFKGHMEIIKILINNGANIHAKDDSGATVLHQAACVGGYAVIEFLLDNGADVNAMDWMSRTPLHFAASHQHEDEIKLLIKRGARIDTMDNNGWMPLSEACIKRHPAIVKLLLEHGANPNYRDPLNLLGPLELSRDSDIVLMLLDYGADPNICQNHRKETILHRAAFHGKENVVKRLLEKGAHFNALTSRGETPLVKALMAAKPNLKVVAILLESDTEDPPTIPLGEAVIQNCEEAVRMFLEKGADVDKRDLNGCTALHHAAKEPIAKLLVSYGAEVSARDEKGRTPLHCAASAGNVAVIQVLLDHGAEIEVCNAEGATPLQRAAHKGHLEAFELLVVYGADIRAQDHSKSNLLHNAARGGNLEMVKFLLSEGIDPFLLNSRGLHALSIAKKMKHMQIFELLLEKWQTQ